MSGTPDPTRAWGWVQHLRTGGTTPWSSWTEPAPPAGLSLPGAQQLELLRRLNAAAPAGSAADPAFAARVLRASGVGRGRPDLALVDPGGRSAPAFGAPPVDPADLDDGELLRFAAGLLADDVVAAGVPEPVPPARPRPWRTRYRLVGDPWLVDPRRDALVTAGHPPGGRHPRVVVLGADLEQMLVDVWSARSLGLGAAVWGRWVDRMVAADALPPQADLARVAARRAAEAGARHVHVVLDPAAAPRLLGVRRSLPGWPVLSADATEVGRRVGEALGLLVAPERRQQLLRGHLLPRLAVLPGPPLALPPRHRRWLRRQAVRVRAELLEAGYPVHGDPDRLLPGDRAADRSGVARPGDAGVLALVVRLLLENRRS